MQNLRLQGLIFIGGMNSHLFLQDCNFVITLSSILPETIFQRYNGSQFALRLFLEMFFVYNTNKKTLFEIS